jgi:SAM-dependent methyltransferase
MARTDLTDRTRPPAVRDSELESKRVVRPVLAWVWSTLLRPVPQLLMRRRTFQIVLSAAFAVGLVTLSHAIGVRVHGQDGDAAVAVPAFLIGLPLFGWLLGRVETARLVPRFASLWLRVRAKNPARAEGIATIIFTVIIGAFLKALNVTVPGLAADLVLAAVAFIVAYLVVAQITNLLVGTLVRQVYSIGAVALGDARSTIFAFVDRRIGRLGEEIVEILSDAGAPLDIEDVEFWTEDCFGLGHGRYDGTDSHLPSEFVKLYPNYLEAHGKMLHDFPPPADKPNHRILIGPHTDFRDDFIDRYDQGYKAFLDGHDDKVKLLHLERGDAERLLAYVAGDEEPLPTLDFGIWYGQYALLFREEAEDAKVRLWMVFPGHPWYVQCEGLIHAMLNGEATQNGKPSVLASPLEEAVPEIFQRDLCRRWVDFVDPTKRMRKLAPFFEHVLGDERAGGILDAAAGIGSDGVWLAENGFNVTLNEIEPVYVELIKERLGEADLSLPLFSVDWRELYSGMGRWFTAVTVLGNSLCLLMSPEQQERAIRAFMDVLLPGGSLLIDERNYEHFTKPDVAALIHQNPVRNFPYRGDAMYCGMKVKGCPKSISERDVVFRYYRNDKSFHDQMMSAVTLTNDMRIELDKREIGSLHLYPFKKAELGKLLLRCGFDDIVVYRDLDWRNPRPFDPSGEGWFDENADFFTYLARKPREGDK